MCIACCNMDLSVDRLRAVTMRHVVTSYETKESVTIAKHEL